MFFFFIYNINLDKRSIINNIGRIAFLHIKISHQFIIFTKNHGPLEAGRSKFNIV